MAMKISNWDFDAMVAVQPFLNWFYESINVPSSAILSKN